MHNNPYISDGKFCAERSFIVDTEVNDGETVTIYEIDTLEDHFYHLYANIMTRNAAYEYSSTGMFIASAGRKDGAPFVVAPANDPQGVSGLQRERYTTAPGLLKKGKAPLPKLVVDTVNNKLQLQVTGVPGVDIKVCADINLYKLKDTPDYPPQPPDVEPEPEPEPEPEE